MARKKLTEEEKQLRKDKKEIKEYLNHYEYELKEIRREFINEPTVFFEVGERVDCGSHKHSVISASFDNGKFYYIHTFGMRNVYGRQEYYEQYWFLAWHDIDKHRTQEDNAKISSLIKNDDLRLSYSQTSLRDILGRSYHFGLDLDPDYQRGHVWNLDDKVKLIDSIFNNVDIGKFVYVHNGYDDEYLYEVLDGNNV